MRERDGQVKASVIDSTNARTIQTEVRDTVAPGTILYTDEHAAYRGISEFHHCVVNHSAKEYVDGMAYTNSIRKRMGGSQAWILWCLPLVQ